MPKPTFFNLPDDKRERFVNAAVEEFAEHGYDHASIRRLVTTLGIAKGSVYQYFDDKYDLFIWLYAECGRRKVASLEAVPDDDTVLGRLRAMYVAGLEWQQKDPVWARFGARAEEPSREERVRALRDVRITGAHAAMRGLLEEGISRGEFRSDLNIDASAWFVYGVLSEGLIQAFRARAGLDIEKEFSRQEGPDPATREQLLEVAHQAVDFLERALGNPT